MTVVKYCTGYLCILIKLDTLKLYKLEGGPVLRIPDQFGVPSFMFRLSVLSIIVVILSKKELVLNTYQN